MKKNSKLTFILVCTLPALILFGVFLVYPMIKAFLISFYRWSGMTKGTEVFVGFKNFKNLLQDSIIWKALLNNMFLMFLVPIVTMITSLFFSVVLTRRKMVDKKFYRTVFFFPNVLSMVIISILWSFVFNPSFGILNSFLDGVGLSGLKHIWLGEAATALPSIGLSMIWPAIGWYMVLYIAAMEGIPPNLYECALIEGANEFQKFKHITLPLIWETVRVSIVFFIINVFNNSFVYVKVMTNGGPDNASQVLSNYMYSYAFSGSSNTNLGYATAIAVFIFIIVSLLSFLSYKLTEKDSVSY